MIERFQGDRGKPLLIDELTRQKLLIGSPDLAVEAAESGELVEFLPETVFIEQGDDTNNDVFLILSGVCSVIINGRLIAKRSVGDSVGEMAAINPTQARSASVVADDKVLALRLTQPALTKLATRYSQIYQSIARALAQRLLQRNALIGAYREKVRLFIISSVEALPIARIVENAFEHDAISVHLWTAPANSGPREDWPVRLPRPGILAQWSA